MGAHVWLLSNKHAVSRAIDALLGRGLLTDFQSERVGLLEDINQALSTNVCSNRSSR